MLGIKTEVWAFLVLALIVATIPVWSKNVLFLALLLQVRKLEVERDLTLWIAVLGVVSGVVGSRMIVTIAAIVLVLAVLARVLIAGSIKIPLL